MQIENPKADVLEVRVDTRGEKSTTVYVLIQPEGGVAHWRSRSAKGTLEQVDLDVEDVLEWEKRGPS
jgi:hypothetical protein